MYIVAAAINAAGAVDSEKIREALTKTKFHGAMGPFVFTANRDPGDASGVVVLEMHNKLYRIFGDN